MTRSSWSLRCGLLLAMAMAIASGGGLALGEDDVADRELPRSGDVEIAWPAVGQALPDVRLPTLDREGAVRLSSFRGKKLLLIEFASW